jgi:putative lipoprotein
MNEHPRHPLPLLGLLTLLTGCATATVVPGSSGGAEAARVTGSVTYRERIALPPTAVVKARLVDVSRADAPAELLAEHAIVVRRVAAPAQP